jgi:hypothetical protein
MFFPKETLEALMWLESRLCSAMISLALDGITEPEDRIILTRTGPTNEDGAGEDTDPDVLVVGHYETRLFHFQDYAL